jgi:stearoyl-CoA desaturase (delta-9 desaturase)
MTNETHPPIHKLNAWFFGIIHVLAIAAVFYMVLVKFSWASLWLGIAYFLVCTFAISAGYHRLFSHPSYKTFQIFRVWYLFFGAATAQNSALKWSADHRVHHSQVDKELDPYNIQKGFVWAHVGWILHEADEPTYENVPDLQKDRWLMHQHRNYVWWVAASNFILPFCLGLLWGDPWGAFLITGCLRLVIEWHSTFSINSVAHLIGTRPYSLANSARDSLFTALLTMGEGYHNFHHRFANDYRNGVRWFHYDPTKWLLWTASKLRLTWDLKKTSRNAVMAAKAKVIEELRAQKLAAASG